VSAFDKGSSFFVARDITDPTPYEHDDRVLEDCVCLLCGREFHKDQGVMELKHRSLDHDRFLVHRNCFTRYPVQVREKLLDILDDFGFEMDEVEEKD
jgi:hypothetical protein